MKVAKLVLVGDKENRYSINALVASAIESGLLEEVGLVITTYSAAPELLRSLRGERVVVGASLLTTQLVKKLDRVIDVVRAARGSGALAIVGGPHASGDPYGSIISLGFDMAVVGDGEAVLPEVVREYLGGGDPCSIEGVACPEGGRVRLRGRGFVKELDPWPSFPLRLVRRFGPVEIGRGCPHACRYCAVSFTFSARMRHRGVGSVVEHVERMRSSGLRDIRFITPNALAYGSPDGRTRNLDAVQSLLEALQPYRAGGMRVFLGSFPSEVRPEHLDEEAARLLRRYVDNKRIIVGAQTGSDELLKKIGRGHTAEDALAAVEAAVSAGFRAEVDYIFGLPGETEEDVDATVEHMREVINLGGRVHAHAFMPLPGTPYSFAPPGKVPEKARKFLIKYAGRGAVYGQWEEQERLAEGIARLRDKGIIIITPWRARQVIKTAQGT